MSEVLAIPECYWSALLAPSVAMDERLSARPSQFEMIAQLTYRLPPHLTRELDMLLAACRTGMDAGPSVLQPMWAEEAMHRACAIMRLLGTRRHPATVEKQQNQARDLAASFRLLDASPAHEERPCSGLLRDVAANLVALFAGGGAGTEDVRLRTHIQPLRLPGYKVRALILAAAELVMNALSHAFPAHASGQIDVTLCLLSPMHARLRVTDDGVGFHAGQPNLTYGVAAGLAELLEANLCYIRTGHLTIAEIAFPIEQTIPAVQ